MEFHLDFETEFGKRCVLYDSIIGSLVRNRTQCVECGATADALMREPFIELELHGNQLVALRELCLSHLVRTRRRIVGALSTT